MPDLQNDKSVTEGMALERRLKLPERCQTAGTAGYKAQMAGYKFGHQEAADE
jgi:hypothetical protein